MKPEDLGKVDVHVLERALTRIPELLGKAEYLKPETKRELRRPRKNGLQARMLALRTQRDQRIQRDVS